MSTTRSPIRFGLPLALLLATTGISGCNGGGKNSPTAPADPVATARTQTYQRINALRATVSLPALTQWTDGEACAAGQAKTDYDASAPHSAFGSCSESAQNEAPDWPSVDKIPTDAVQAMWDEGPGSDYSTHGHYMNMTNTSYHKVAVGIYVTPANTVWAVMNFAP